MKKTWSFVLSLILASVMLCSMVWAEDAADAGEAAETVEATDTADAAEAADPADAGEELTLEEMLGESEGISVDVPLSTDGEIVMEPFEPLEISSNDVNVQDYEIESVISSILTESTQVEEITEGVVEEGDNIVIDFTGVLEGEEEPFQGGSATDQSVTLGSGTFIPGFEEQVTGHSIGETFDIQVTFPEDYYEELAGKNAVFTITIKSKTIKTEPELNDAFVRQYASQKMEQQLQTVDELKTYIRDLLYNRYLNEAIMAALRSKANVVSYPEDRFLVLKEYSLIEIANQATMYAMYGMGDLTPDMVAKMNGYNTAEDYANEQAMHYLRDFMMIDEVTADLGIEVTEEEINDYTVQYLEANGITEEQVQAVYGENEGWNVINRYNLLVSRVMEEMKKQVVIVEGFMTYQDFMLAEVGAPVEIELYVQQPEKWHDGVISAYAADSSGGYYLSDMQCSQEDAEKLVPGTMIHVTGQKADVSGEVAIADAVFSILEDKEPFLSTPLDATYMLGTSQLVNYINQRVQFHDLTVNGAVQAAEDGDLTFQLSYNDEVYPFLVEANLCPPESEVYQTVSGLQEGDVVTVEGYLHWNEGPNPVVTAVTVQ